MPVFDFKCEKCSLIYEALVKYDGSGKYPSIKCPKCKSKKKDKLTTGFNFNFTNPVGTDRWNDDSTGHDYRYKHNLPKVKETRKRAEAASHMGTQPYSEKRDVESGKYFGEVK
jgi:putative FmdB family regulatory protein